MTAHPGGEQEPATLLRRRTFTRQVLVTALAGMVVGGALFGALGAFGSGSAGSGSAPSGPSSNPAAAPQATRQGTSAKLASLPLAFAPWSTGSSGGATTYVAEGDGYGARVTATSLELTLGRPGAARSTPVSTAGRPAVAGALAPAQVDLQLIGARAGADVTGSSTLAGRLNVFVGARSSWRSDLPTYGAVVVHDAWPGVNVRYAGSGGGLEYTVTVAPGADPASVRLRTSGLRGLHLDARGNLVGQSAGGPVTEQALQAYQLVDGARQPVAVAFALHDGTVSFRVGHYDHQVPLVIDPTVVSGWDSYLGGNGIGQVEGVATDASGDVYAVGYTDSATFPVQNAVQGTYSGNPYSGSTYGGGDFDAFVTELNPSGTQVLFSTYLGGYGADQANAVALGPGGTVYLAGMTDSPNFPVTDAPTYPNDNNILRGAEFDGFITVLAAGGAGIDWSTMIGGSGEDEIEAMAISPQGTAYVAGLTTSPDFYGLPGAAPAGTTADLGVATSYASRFRNAYYFNERGFVATVSDAGAGPTVGWVTPLASTGPGFEVDAVALDASGNAYVAGGSAHPIAPTGGAYGGATAYDGTDGGFVAKLGSTGTIDWLAWLGKDMQLYGIALDAAGNVDVVGAALPGLATTTGVVGPTHDPSSRGPQAMAASLSPDGATLRWATYLGGTGGASQASAVLVAPDGTLEIAGGTAATSGVATAGAPQTAFGGSTSDAFVTDLSADATAVQWGTYLGGSGTDWATSLAPVADGVAVAGLTTTGFPTTAGSFEPASGGSQAGFVGTLLVDPSVSSLSPTTGFTTGGTSVTISGDALTGATAVHFGSTTAAFAVVSDTEITATAPPGSGTVDVTVTTPAGTSATTPADRFTYTQPPPGYWLSGADGGVFAFGDAGFFGSCPAAGSGCTGVTNVVGMATTPDGHGYWLVGADGGVYAFGDAAFAGSCPAAGSGCTGVTNVVGIAVSPSGGYWLVGADGGVFAFGDAGFFGSCPAAGSGCTGVRDVVGMATTPDGHGYWLVGADGGMYSFGDAVFAGSEGGDPLAAPVVGTAAHPVTA